MLIVVTVFRIGHASLLGNEFFGLFLLTQMLVGRVHHLREQLTSDLLLLFGCRAQAIGVELTGDFEVALAHLLRICSQGKTQHRMVISHIKLEQALVDGHGGLFEVGVKVVGSECP